jgi:integrase
VSPRTRKTKKHLPTRMYFNRGFYWFVTHEGKWKKLAKDEKESLKLYAEIIADGESKINMSALLTRYKNEVIPTKAKSTQRNNLREIENLRLAFGKMHPTKIKPKHIGQYIDHRNCVAGNREISLLSNVFTKAKRWGIVDINPCTGVDRFKGKKKEGHYISNKQYQAVYKIANDRIRIVMEIARITGLRQGDILRLKWQQLSDDGLLVKNEKTGKRQLFELTPRLAELLQAAKNLQSQVASVYIIHDTKGQPWTSSGFQTAWQRLCKGNPNRFQFRDLRAKAVSDSGSLEQGSKLANHTDKRVTERHYFRLPKKVKPNE